MLSWYQLLTWVCNQSLCHTTLPLPALLLRKGFAKTQDWRQGFCIFLARLMLGNPAGAVCPVHVGGEKLELGNNPPWPSTDRNSPHHLRPTTPQPTDRASLQDLQILPGSLLVERDSWQRPGKRKKKKKELKMKHRLNWREGMSTWLWTRSKQNFCRENKRVHLCYEHIAKNINLNLQYGVSKTGNSLSSQRV